MSNVFEEAGINMDLLPAEYKEYMNLPDNFPESPLKVTEAKPIHEWRIQDEDYMEKVREEARNNPLLKWKERYI